MIAQLTTHLWQSTFFAIAAGLLTLAFRRNRAQVRYWLWLSASLKFFIPFSLLMILGSRMEWAPSAHRIATEIAAPALSDTLEQFSQPFFPVSSPSSAPTPETAHWIPVALFTLWLCGFVAIALIRFRNWLRIRSAVRTSTAVNIQTPVEVRSSPGLLEPGVVGLLRPILLLPEGILERLTPAELEAVLAHELCHIRRRDNLFAAAHMIVEAAFWFHPLVWWIGARLVEERERACDEEVVRLGNQPGVYADAILNLCKLYLESPLACVSGVTGADIRRRIEAIMTNPVARGLTHAKKILLAIAGIAALAGPVVIGLVMGIGNTPSIRAQSPTPKAATPIQIAQAQAAPTPTPATPKPKFDAASIKLCAPGQGVGTGRGGGAGGSGLRVGYNLSPGRLSIWCLSVAEIVNQAYILGVDDLPVNSARSDLQLVRGGPAWAHQELPDISDRYTIEAETDDPTANGPTMPGNTPAARIMMGPMLQSLLEDRFHLKLHREVEQVPMYALTVAKSGFKLKPLQEGDCTQPTAGPLSPLAPDGKPWCNLGRGSLHGPNHSFDESGVSLSGFAKATLSNQLDHYVIDKTGITGMFSFHLEFAVDENAPGMRDPPGVRPHPPVMPDSDITPGPSVFTALEQQLGLKLELIKGPHGFIVIDHVERPSEN